MASLVRCGTTSPVDLGLPIKKNPTHLRDALKNILTYFGLSAQKGGGGMGEIPKKLLDQKGIQMLRMAPK